MAKLKGPLFSLGASQQIGKALVYFSWKGLNVVREYVVPSNPKTTAQLLQRSYVTAAVAKIHVAQARAVNSLDIDDVMAYSLWASVVKAATTWFNQAIKMWLDCMVASKHPCVFSGGYAIDKSHGNATFGIYFNEESGGALVAGKFYLGTSKTALINSMLATIAGAIEADNILNPFVNLTAGVKYYWQFRPDTGDASEGAWSGIYYFKAT